MLPASSGSGEAVSPAAGRSCRHHGGDVHRAAGGLPDPAPRHRDQRAGAGQLRRRALVHAAGTGRGAAPARRWLRGAGLARRRRGSGRCSRSRSSHADAGELGWSGETTMSTRVRIRLVQGEGIVLDGPPRPVPRRRRAPGRARRGARVAARGGAAAGGPARGRAQPRPGAGARPRRGRLRPPHVPVRSVGLRQDVRARRAARAAAAGDEPEDRRPGPELGLRAPPGAAGRRRERARPPLGSRVAPAIAVHRAENAGAAAPARSPGRAGAAHAGRGAATRPDPRPRRVRRADDAAATTCGRTRSRSCSRPVGRARRAGAARGQPRRGQWGVWARTDPAPRSTRSRTRRCAGLVVDLGSLATHDEQRWWRTRCSSACGSCARGASRC